MDRLMRIFAIGLTTLVMSLSGTNDALPSDIKPLPEDALTASERSGKTAVSAHWLQSLLREEMLLASSWDPGMLEIQAIDPTSAIEVQGQPVAYQIEPPTRVSPGRRAQIGVRLYDENSQVIRLIRVSGRVDLYRNIWVLNAPTRSGEILKEGNISLQRRHVREIPPGALEDPRELLGMQARKNLLMGAVLQRDQWEIVPLVRRGQRVLILLETSHMRLVAPGQSLADGGQGEPVRVLNLSSRQVVHALVRDQQTVQVPF